MILLLQIIASACLISSGLFLAYKVCMDLMNDGFDNGSGGQKVKVFRY